MHDELNDDLATIDHGPSQDDLIGVASDEAAPARWPTRSMGLAFAGAVALAALAFGIWRIVGVEPMVPLAVPPGAATAAGEAIARAGIEVEWRQGRPWVAASQVARATDVAGASLASGRPAHPAASAAADENVFLSTEAARSKRLVATMSAIEQMIECQAGVERARVVIAEATRPGSPGTAYSGPSAAATVTMREGEMSQDLVDAVAALVSGSLPGLATERVAVIDANANRHRTARTAQERHVSDARRERERELADRLRTALPAVATVHVSLESSADAPNAVRAHAVVVLSNAHAQRIIAAQDSLPPDVALATEEARVMQLAEAVLPRGVDGLPASVVVTLGRMDLAGTWTETTPPIAASGEPVNAALERERLTPLGPGTTASGAWDAGTLGLLVLALGAVASAVVFTHRKNASRAVPALAGMGREGVPGVFEPTPQRQPVELADMHEASESVRAETSQSVTVVRGWLDAGYDARAAHLVVALDSGAAGALLRAMPAHLVNRITVALAGLRTPTADELQDAADALMEELAML
ncbi:MAG: hypothetical protein JNK53_05720, partial [Phycisphaerae bacterium]|nr:hypothetical protein [Phycisphaerae bacterium]